MSHLILTFIFKTGSLRSQTLTHFSSGSYIHFKQAINADRFITAEANYLQ